MVELPVQRTAYSLSVQEKQYSAHQHKSLAHHNGGLHAEQTDKQRKGSLGKQINLCLDLLRRVAHWTWKTLKLQVRRKGREFQPKQD